MTYDGIILGSGHNSLVLQAYLGRAGLKVLCLERRHVPEAAWRRRKTRGIRGSCTTRIRSITGR